MHAHSLLLDSLQPFGLLSTGSSVHWISQARILEWTAIFFSRGSSRFRDWTQLSCIFCISRRILYLLSHQSVCKMLLPDWLINYPEKAPSCPEPSWILWGGWGYTLCHTETGKDVFKADDNKNNLLFLVKSTDGLFFLFSFLFILFLLMGMRPVWAFPDCSVVKNLSAKQ